MSINTPKIGLALSGGGSRAIAFHLGCLRALHSLGILDDIRVLSTVSGGSVIGAIYAAHTGSFDEFERKIRKLLARGLLIPSIRKAVTTSEGIKALFCWIILVTESLLLFLLSRIGWAISFLVPSYQHSTWWLDRWWPPFHRFASRTTILRRVLHDDIYDKALLRDLPSSAPQIIINAADLRTGSAFYFSPQSSGSWRLGELADADISLAHAVTASAAYPLLLPALDERMSFHKSNGARCDERVNLTDGGVYDNLALAPLWPDRDPSVSLNVNEIDMIICCRAGYGLRFEPPSQFLVSRLTSAFSCINDRAQNASMNRLFDLKGSGKIRGFVLPYLGQIDSHLKYPPADLVTREETYNYPTDFSAMPEEWINRLGMRGEQLTKAVIAEHYPNLTSS